MFVFKENIVSIQNKIQDSIEVDGFRLNYLVEDLGLNAIAVDDSPILTHMDILEGYGLQKI